MTITSMGFSAQPARLQQLQEAMFKTADADGDGQLSLSEFQSVGQNVQGRGEMRGPPPMRGGEAPGGRFSSDTLLALLSTQSVDEVAGAVMEAGDADGDGLLSADELSSALSANAPSDAPADASAKMAAHIMSALDTDDDGSLSTTEISTAVSNAASNRSSSTQAMRGPPPGPPPGRASAASGSNGFSGVFESLVTNQDGVVSADELAAANDSSAEASRAASDLIKAADQDGDGALSGGEFYAMLEEGQTASTSTAETTVTLNSLMSGSNAAADLMQKLLVQLDSALTSSSPSSTSISATA